MPEAAVDEDDLAAGAEDDVGFARQILAMQPEAVAQGMDHPSDKQFRRRAAAPDPAYILAARRRRKMVGQSLPPLAGGRGALGDERSEEHTSELQSLMRISYAVFCLNKTKNQLPLCASSCIIHTIGFTLHRYTSISQP